jgi:hypothetical protein
MAKTQAHLTYTADGMPDVTFFDNKTRNGVELSITPVEGCKYPKVTYTVKSSDANAVALEAVGLAKDVLNTSAAIGGAVVGLPIK